MKHVDFFNWKSSSSLFKKFPFQYPIACHLSISSHPRSDSLRLNPALLFVLFSTCVNNISHVFSAIPSVVAIIPPPPDIQPVIDKLAEYVARNGIKFETSVRAKNDPRWVKVIFFLIILFHNMMKESSLPLFHPAACFLKKTIAHNIYIKIPRDYLMILHYHLRILTFVLLNVCLLGI